MATETVYIVQAYVQGRGKALRAEPQVGCKDAEEARRKAERLAPLRLGVVAFALNFVPIMGPFAGVGLFAFAGLLQFDTVLLAFLPASCGRVIDVPLPFDAQLDTKASEQIGWNVSSHYTIFEGLCPNCR